MRRIVAATLVLPLLLAVTGCRDDEGANAENTPALAGPPQGPDDVSAAGDTASAPGEGRVPRIGLRKFVRLTRHVLATKKGVHLDLELKTRSITITAKADQHLNPGPQALEEEIATSSASIAQVMTIMTPGHMWVSVEGYMRPGTWAPVDVSTSNGLFGPDSAVISSVLDPVSAVLANRAGFQRFRYVGPSPLYGIPMAHYKLYVDGKRAAAGRGGSTALQRAMPSRLVYDLWLDHDQLVRKVKVRVGHLRASIEMSDWGKPVHVRVPGARSYVPLPGSA